MKKNLFILVLALMVATNSWAGNVVVKQHNVYYSADGNRGVAEVIYSSTYYDRFEFTIIDIVYGCFVKKIGNSAFRNSTHLRAIDIPNSVTFIGNYAFQNCVALESIIIPNHLMYLGNGAFNGCTSLTSIEIPDEVAIIGREVFEGCSNLKSITCLGTKPPKLGSSDNFDYQSVVLHVKPGCKAAYSSAKNWSNFKNIIEDAIE